MPRALPSTLAAAAQLAAVPALFLAAAVAPINEPFADWGVYYLDFLTLIGAIFPILAFLIMLIPIQFLMANNAPRPWQARANQHPEAFICWLTLLATIVWAHFHLIARLEHPWVNMASQPALPRPLVQAALIGGTPLWILPLTGTMLVCTVRRASRAIAAIESAAASRCRKCGYSLEGLTTPRCPECGHDNT